MALPKRKITELSIGLLICLSIAAVSWWLGSLMPLIGGAVFAIVLGIIIRTVLKKSSPVLFDKALPGVSYSGKKILQYAIILLGFEMNFFTVLQVGKQSLVIMIFTLTSAFITTWVVAKALHIPSKLATLVGVGTSICGGSAIAATAPVLDAEDDDISTSISIIFLFNILAVFIFPAVGHLLKMTDTGFGMWAGTAINDTSSVVAAASAWSEAAKNSVALNFATIVKLTRTLMIVPITLVLAFVMSARASKADTSHNSESIGSSIMRTFPWFILGFLAAALITTFLPADTANFTHGLAVAGKFFIVMAMAGIGMKTDLTHLIKNGIKPLTLGLICWIVVGIVSLVVQHFIGLL